METAEILAQFEWARDTFPEAAVAEAVRRRNEITPALLAILENTATGAELLNGPCYDTDVMDHLFAMYLLAQFRETRAYRPLLRIASLPEDLLESLLGETVTDDLGRILASVCGGEIKGIQSLIEDENAGESSRIAALDGLLCLVVAGLKSREEILAYFGELLRGRLKRKRSAVWDLLICNLCDLCAVDLRDEIARAYQEGLVDNSFMSLKDVRTDIEAGKEAALERLARKPGITLIDDASAEMRDWAFAKPPVAEPPKSAEAVVWTTPATAAPVKESKMGRNEQCPCGSGKKY